MAFVRQWQRALLGASGATLLVPVGLVLAVVVAATLGGSGLGSLTQVVGGPALPAGEPAAQHGSGATRTTPTTTVAELPTVRRVRADIRAAAPRGAAPAGSAPAARRTPRRAVRTPARRVGSRRPSTLPRPRRPTPAATAPAPAVPTPSAPPPPAETNPVRRIGAAVQKTAAAVPVVGPAAADAVGTVIDLIAPPSSAAPRAAAPAQQTVAAAAPAATQAVTQALAPTGG